ncbi:DeoR/GlpR family DNA-binding transcription regulator [Methylovirgula sp. 4M-Z18]|uniref:DeoR/GlpR family DNA-binding transcription regulator n=1 Tax=Methylovirgula sp. 4M-Z18 TaxID=2293567 RepID=UPI000E2EC0E8|nr:DeoR/GlpR family DNA-binding transcription regulator [Methylovirgula sp. 4M-Z18]RFB80113.1 DeoR/GlpR transcriptional regulator [Methylovirgula sp. 4M-Z18]
MIMHDSIVASLLPEQRHRLIQERLAAQGRVLAGDLARELGTSEDTIRRDLRELADQGICRRVYGGALPVAAADKPVAIRNAENLDSKTRLAQVAVTFVAQGQLLFLDAGSTNLAIARALPDDMPLIAATNAPAIALALAEKGNIETILIGGRLDSHTGAALGAEAMQAIATLSPDICFLGACAVAPDGGVSVFHFEDAAFKRALAVRSRQIIVAATSDKLGTSAPFHVLNATQLTHLCVEADAPEEFVGALKRGGMSIRSAQP